MDSQLVQYVEDKHDLIREGRTLKADYGIPILQEVEYRIRPSSPDAAERLQSDERSLRTALRASRIFIDPDWTPSRATPGGVTKLGTIYLPLEGLLDPSREKARLTAELEKVAHALDRANAKLANLDFLQKARPMAIEKQKGLQRELIERGQKLRRMLHILDGISDG